MGLAPPLWVGNLLAFSPSTPQMVTGPQGPLEAGAPEAAARKTCSHRAHGSGASTQRKRLWCQPHPPLHAPLNRGTLLLLPTWVSSMNTSVCSCTTLQAFQAISAQPAAAPSPHLLSAPQVPVPAPLTPADLRLRLGCAGSGAGPLQVLLCPASRSLMAGFSSEPLKLALCPGSSPCCLRGFIPWEPFLLPHTPPARGAGPILLPFSSLFLPGYVGLFHVLSGVWGLLVVFSRGSVRTVPFVDVFLMYLWEEVSSISFYSAVLFRASVIERFIHF